MAWSCAPPPGSPLPSALAPPLLCRDLRKGPQGYSSPLSVALKGPLYGGSSYSSGSYRSFQPVWLIISELLSTGERKTSEIRLTCLPGSKGVGPFILGFQNQWHISVPSIVYVRCRSGLLLLVHYPFRPGLGWLACFSKHTFDPNLSDQVFTDHLG